MSPELGQLAQIELVPPVGTGDAQKARVDHGCSESDGAAFLAAEHNTVDGRITDLRLHKLTDQAVTAKPDEYVAQYPSPCSPRLPLAMQAPTSNPATCSLAACRLHSH
ncbi:MAG: hypothetical protein AAF801_03740 [Pseudomonadota bacterium]